MGNYDDWYERKGANDTSLLAKGWVLNWVGKTGAESWTPPIRVESEQQQTKQVKRKHAN